MNARLHATATACGKVIVVGEHSVVYGYPALAAGLPEGLCLRAEPLDNPRAPSRLSIPAWDLDLTLELRFEHPVANAALEVLGFCDAPLQGWSIRGQTSLPSRAGLGSSAALSVALARLALGQDADLATVVEASLCGERVFHGEPSGIDSEVAARGGLLRFSRGEPAEPIPLPQPLRLCIVPSGLPRSTADQVAKVKARFDRSTTLTKGVLEALGVAVNAATTAISTNNMADLGEIMDISHGLLCALGVSSPILDELCSTAREHGALGAKLTGAGGGGCMLALPPSPLVHDGAPLLNALRSPTREPLLVDIRS